MEHVAVLVTHRARVGQRDAVRAVWETHLAPAIAADPSHISYTYCFDEADPEVICALQIYRNAGAATAFRSHTPPPMRPTRTLSDRC